MKIVFLTVLTVLINLSLCGQDSTKVSLLNKNHLSIEMGGAGVFGSINYERLIIGKPLNKLLFRVGFFILPTSNDKAAILPFGLYYLNGVKNHLELGLNNSFFYRNYEFNKTIKKF